LLRGLPKLPGQLGHGCKRGLRLADLAQFEEPSESVFMCLHDSFLVADLHRYAEELGRQVQQLPCVLG
jgi:hypothetical protein